MIKYRTRQGVLSFFSQLFQRAGSVFPAAFRIALPCMAATVGLTIFIQRGELRFLEKSDSVLKDNAAWGGFSFLVGFLIVFRTSQSYNRFWEGCQSTHHMRAEWFDGCSSLIAFCKHSKADPELVSNFQNRLVRLFSMLHAAALAEIEDCAGDEVNDYEAFNFALLDAEGIDETSLLVIKASTAKVELIFQWIQQLVVENIDTGVLSIPPPILSRSFQEIANGMVAFHDAMKISYIPFPFPYAQTCDFLLVLHWIIVPFVVCQWVTEPVWAAVFSFIQVFILWALNFIAVELENPFGLDANDIDGWHMQEEMNEHLLLLMSPSTKSTPHLSGRFKDLSGLEYWMGKETRHTVGMLAQKSFSEVWQDLEFNPRGGDAFCARYSTMPPARRSHAVNHAHCHGPGSARNTSRASRVSGPVRFSDGPWASSPNRQSLTSYDWAPKPSPVSPNDPAVGLSKMAEFVASSDGDMTRSNTLDDERMIIVLEDDNQPVGEDEQGKKWPLEIEDTPDEPAPLQLQKVHVLDKSNLKSPEKGGNFVRAEERLLRFEVRREDTCNSERPTSAPQSTEGMREDTILSSRNDTDSANLASTGSAGSSRSAPRKAEGEGGPLQESDNMGQVLYNMLTTEIQRQMRPNTATTVSIDSGRAEAKE